MMRQLYAMTLALCLVSFAQGARAADFVVTSISQNGSISWDDVNTNGTYSVEWSSSLHTNWSSDWSQLTQIPSTGGAIVAQIPMFFRVLHRPIESPSEQMRLVSGGGQINGPSYDFYMGAYEVLNEQYCAFLNNAQANTNNARGANMHFGNSGNVYFNPSLSSDEILFAISDSRLTYTPSAATGSRYTVQSGYLGHPAVGVSFIGAFKYCNWLTIHDGRGEAQRCYTEGSGYTDWHPANITWAQWEDGLNDSERLEWVQNYSGFRLPMDHYSETADAYNEFYKAGAWNGLSNTTYGFGRSTVTTQDANYASSGDPYEVYVVQTTPAGYYDGSDYDGTFQTASNGNYYGIYDLTGNVWEWVTENYPGYGNRITRGGSWESSTGFGFDLTFRNYSAQTYYTTRKNTGFRIVSTSP